MSRGRRLNLLIVALAAALVAGVLTPASHAAESADATFRVRPSVNQVAVLGAPSGTSAVLEDSDGGEVATRRIDTAGSALFRRVAAGSGYRVTIGDERSAPVTVTSPDDTPPSSLHTGQVLEPGYGYLETRDGTLLAANVVLPGPADEGPYPTVVEYSGYDPADPDEQQPSSRIAQLLGYATVGVNLRGTGCSGGAFDYFETLQALDGYDVIETVAAQPWVAHGEVGMIGISYPGITQLFVAGTQPPHLAAITPLSVLDDTYHTLYPGGIFNNGFALEWAEDRQEDGQPSTADGGGQEWASDRIAAGDATCRDNQELRLQAANVGAEIRVNRFRRGALTDALAPATFVPDIEVPVFLAGTWQDQETGSHFANMLGDFSSEIPLKITLMNGIHQDSLGPSVLTQWIEFLAFYVAREIPSIPPVARLLGSTLLAGIYGPGVSIGPDRFTDEPDYATALRAYESEPTVRLLFDVGAGGRPRVPIPGFTSTASAWPIPDTTASTYFLGADGVLSTTRPTGRPTGSGSASDTFAYDPAAFPRTMTTRDSGREGSEASPGYGWKTVPDGKALAYVSAPLAVDTVMAGTGSVDLWLQSTQRDVDLEVTISEVRPDGNETYVQSGWLRASQRALDRDASTALLPVQTHARADVAPLPTGTSAKPAQVRVPLYPFAHAFREGSRIRIVVQPPGGNRPSWAFDSIPPRGGSAEVTVTRSAAKPSQVVLPVVSGVDVSTPLPPCGSLRGQPCRAYLPLENRSDDR